MRIRLAITDLGSGRNLACALLVAINLSPVLVGPISTPVFAADRPTTEADCEKAEMIWKKQEGKCAKISGNSLSPTLKVVGLIGFGCAISGLLLLWLEIRNAGKSRVETSR